MLLVREIFIATTCYTCICNANLTFFVCSPYYRSWEGCLAPFLVSKMPLWVETGGVLLSGAPPLRSVEMMMKTLDEMMMKTLDVMMMKTLDEH